MNQKAYSVLFCALLASTFVHELRAKGIAPVSSRLRVFKRTAAPIDISEIKNSFSQTSFGLSIQVVENILVIANLSANVAILIDVSGQIVVALNGISGEGVAIDLVAQTGVYVKSELWVAADASLEVFIQCLSGGLRAICDTPGAISFNVSSASAAILAVNNEIIVKLVNGVSDELTVDAKQGLQLLIAVSKSLNVLLNGPLKGLLDIICSQVIHISNDLTGFVNVLQGLSAIIVAVSGSLTALIAAGVNLDLQSILGASDGLVVLINILQQIGPVNNIGSPLGGLLNNAENLFKLLAQLGGNASFGVNGVFLVIANIVAYINKKATIETMINVLIHHVVSSSLFVASDLSSHLNAMLSALLPVVQSINASGSLSGLVSIIQGLVQENLVIGEVNISAIIKLLLKVYIGASSLLVLLVSVVLQLKSVVGVSVLIPHLLLVLLFKLNSAVGISQLKALGIKISVDLSKGVGGILKSILANKLGLFAALFTGKFHAGLVGLPVIGTIAMALNAAIETAHNGKISLMSILNGSASAKHLLLGLFQHATEFKLGVPQAVIAKIKTMLEKVSSVSSFLHFKIH